MGLIELGMLVFLILLPLLMISILSMTFEVSVDELSNASRGNYFKYDSAKNVFRHFEDRVIFVVSDPWGDPEHTASMMENSVRCKCSCSTIGQEWDSNQCEGTGKESDATVCPPDSLQICPTGTVFHSQLCRCVQIDSTFTKRRRRPPV